MHGVWSRADDQDSAVLYLQADENRVVNTAPRYGPSGWSRRTGRYGAAMRREQVSLARRRDLRSPPTVASAFLPAAAWRLGRQDRRFEDPDHHAPHGPRLFPGMVTLCYPSQAPPQRSTVSFISMAFLSLAYPKGGTRWSEQIAPILAIRPESSFWKVYSS